MRQVNNINDKSSKQGQQVNNDLQLLEQQLLEASQHAQTTTQQQEISEALNKVRWAQSNVAKQANLSRANAGQHRSQAPTIQKTVSSKHSEYIKFLSNISGAKLSKGDVFSSYYDNHIGISNIGYMKKNIQGLNELLLSKSA